MTLLESLLIAKSHCLEEILGSTREFISRQGLDMDGVIEFDQHRLRLERRLGVLDRQIRAQAAPQIHRPLLEQALRTHVDIVGKILDIHSLAQARIQEIAKKLELELAHSRKNQKILGKFKSTWIAPSGEELDQTL